MTAARKEIATRARGTPRVANNLINFVRDFAQERAKGKMTQPVAAAALELLEIDAAGLDEMDKRMLRVMAENYKGGPVGTSTIAIAVGEETADPRGSARALPHPGGLSPAHLAGPRPHVEGLPRHRSESRRRRTGFAAVSCLTGGSRVSRDPEATSALSAPSC